MLNTFPVCRGPSKNSLSQGDAPGPKDHCPFLHQQASREEKERYCAPSVAPSAPPSPTCTHSPALLESIKSMLSPAIGEENAFKLEKKLIPLLSDDAALSNPLAVRGILIDMSVRYR